MKQHQGRTVCLTLAVLFLSLCIASTSAVAAGLDPGLEKAMDQYEKGDIEGAMATMEKWRGAKEKYDNCKNNKQLKDTYKGVYTRKEFKEGKYSAKEVKAAMFNLQRVVEHWGCVKK